MHRHSPEDSIERGQSHEVEEVMVDDAAMTKTRAVEETKTIEEIYDINIILITRGLNMELVCAEMAERMTTIIMGTATARRRTLDITSIAIGLNEDLRKTLSGTATVPVAGHYLARHHRQRLASGMRLLRRIAA